MNRVRKQVMALISKKGGLRLRLAAAALAAVFLFSGPLTAYAGEAGAAQAGNALTQEAAPAETSEDKAPPIITPLGIVHRIQFAKARKFCEEQFRKARAQQEATHEHVHPMAQQFRELSDYLEEKMEAWNGTEKWAVSVILEDGKLSGAFGYEEPMVSASLIKLYVAGACMEESEEEESQEEESEKSGVSGRVLTQMDVMISRSDNEACNALIARLGMDEINAFIEREGFADTQLRRRMLEARTETNENMTSVKDCGQVLYEILHGEYVSEEASERILNDMKKQERRWKIPAGLPEGIESANKTGELDDVENDAAIVWGEKTTYIVCIMSENVQPGRAQERISELSAEIYRILNQ